MTVEQPEFPRDVAYDQSKEEILKKLTDKENKDSPFRGRTYADVFLYAMALGYHNRKHIPLKKAKRNIPSNALGAEGQWLIMALAVKKAENLNVLLDLKKAVSIAEEYANGGFDFLMEILQGGLLSDPDKKLESDIRKILQK